MRGGVQALTGTVARGSGCVDGARRPSSVSNRRFLWIARRPVLGAKAEGRSARVPPPPVGRRSAGRDAELEGA